MTLKNLNKMSVSLKDMLGKDVLKNKKKSKELIALDIGHMSIQLVLGNNKDKINAIIMDEKKLVQRIEQGELDIDEKVVVETIKSLIQKNNIKQKNVVLTVESHEVIKREMTLPVMDSEMILNAINFEISEYLPIEIEEYIIQYTEIERFEIDGVEKINILVYAFPKTLAKKYFDILKSAELVPYALDISSSCLQKLVSSSKINKIAADKGTFALIDIGNKGINITILKDGKHEFNRLVKGNTSLRRSLVEDNICSEEEVDQIINTYTKESIFTQVVSEREQKIQEEIIYVVDAWISDILKLFQYYTSRNNANKIDYVYIYGGGAKIKNVEYYMGSRMNIPTEAITSIENLDISYNSVDKDVTKYVNCISALIGR